MFRKPSSSMFGWTRTMVKMSSAFFFGWKQFGSHSHFISGVERADGMGGAAFLPFQQIIDRSHEGQFTYVVHHHIGSQFKNNLLLELPGFDLFPRPLSDV